MIEHAQDWGSRARVRSLAAAALPASLIGLAAGSLGYAAHHTGPLESHALEVVASVGLLAALLGATFALAGTLRRAPSLPEVIVAESSGGVEVRAAARSDMEFIGALHARTLDHGFFVTLGPGFLHSYHATFVDSPHAVSFIATLGGHPVGFLAGVLRPGPHRRWVLRRRGMRLAAKGAFALASRPRTALRFMSTRLARYARALLRHQGAEPRAAGASEGDPPAVLLHVTVVPGVRGSGVGRALVDAFVGAARDAGVGKAALVTVGDDNGAGAFYARLGWSREGGRHTPDGLRLSEWTLPLELSPRSR